MRAPTLVVDDMDGLTASNPSARLHYVVESEIDGTGRPLGGMRRLSPALTAADRARFLQLPPLAPEIGALARGVTAGSPDAEDMARRISAHLSTNYRYTLALKRQTALAPLEEVLFVRRSGNCEYFVAARLARQPQGIERCGPRGGGGATVVAEAPRARGAAERPGGPDARFLRARSEVTGPPGAGARRRGDRPSVRLAGRGARARPRRRVRPADRLLRARPLRRRPAERRGAPGRGALARRARRPLLV